MPEIELNTETVRRIVDMVHAFHAQGDVILPDEREEDAINEDVLMQFATDFGSDPYYQELKTKIDDLEPDQQMTLVALMWVGRGDYTLDEWDDAMEFAEESWTDHTAEYLLGTPLLSDYLQEALELLETEED